MEKIIKPTNGYAALCLSVVFLGITIFSYARAGNTGNVIFFVVGVVSMLACITIWKGLIIIQPNTARVLNLFGKYVGSVKENGIFFVNPFYTANKLTQRVQNLAIPTLKVNDKMGNPVEIAGVIVWQIQDTYKAAYDVADYNAFVRMQSEAALRTLTMGFAYDNIEDEHAVVTLREGGAKINELLEKELNERLVTAGIIIKEARISHLAYAQEIAGAMLQRQQASAIVQPGSR